MRPFLKLLNDNRSSPRRFEVKAEANEVTIYLYDVIVSDAMTAEWLGGVAPEPFIKALREITAPVIHLRINSPGGDVFAARAIEQAIREHPAKVIAHVDGYAASAATLVAMASDEVVMSQGSFLMIHNSWTLSYGDSQSMLDTAELLEKIDGTIATTYAQRTGKPVNEIRTMMADETWFTADEALDQKFADRVSDQDQAQASWNLSVYAHTPKVPPAPAPAAALAPAPAPDVPEPTPVNARDHEHDERRRRLRVVARIA